MEFQNKRNSSIDFLFIITLFCVFLLCGIFVILFGVRTYQHIVSGSSHNYYDRTAIAYITNKIHQHDTKGHVSIVFGDNNETCLCLTSSYKEATYNTYLYTCDGFLCEITLPGDIPFDATGGTKLFEVSHFNVISPKKNLLQITLTDSDNQVLKFYVSLRSDQVFK